MQTTTESVTLVRDKDNLLAVILKCPQTRKTAVYTTKEAMVEDLVRLIKNEARADKKEDGTISE